MWRNIYVFQHIPCMNEIKSVPLKNLPPKIFLQKHLVGNKKVATFATANERDSPLVSTKERVL